MRKIVSLSILIALRASGSFALIVHPRHPSTGNVAKKWTGAAALATTFAASSFLFPQSAIALDPPPATALVLNVDVSDPKALVKSVFEHRSGIMNAANDFVKSIKTLGTDLDGVLPPNSASVSVQLPSDLKAAARDAESGRARIMVNGSPVYVEVNSEQEFLALRVLIKSPFLPKIPFMAPTQEAIQIPAAFRVEKPEVKVVAAPVKPTGLLDRQIAVPGTDVHFSILQAIEGVLIAIPSAYALSFAYYVWEKEDNANQAAAKKKKVA